MAIINTPKSFNKQSLTDPKLVSVISPFIDYVNQNFDQFGRAFQNQLSFKDNFHGEIQNVSLKHNHPISVTAKSAVAYAYPLATANDAIRAFQFTTASNTTLSVTALFQKPIPIQVKAQTAASGNFGKYQATNIGAVGVGDLVQIAGLGNKINNVDAGIVLWKSTETSGPVLTVYNGNGVAAETLTDFRGSAEIARVVTLLLLYA